MRRDEEGILAVVIPRAVTDHIKDGSPFKTLTGKPGHPVAIEFGSVKVTPDASGKPGIIRVHGILIPISRQAAISGRISMSPSNRNHKTKNRVLHPSLPFFPPKSI